MTAPNNNQQIQSTDVDESKQDGLVDLTEVKTVLKQANLMPDA